MVLSRLLFLSFVLVLPPSTIARAQAFSDARSLKYAGAFRKAVKNRTAADGANYTVRNGGQPITADEWFALVCGFDPKVRSKNITTSTPVMNTLETIKVDHDPQRLKPGVRRTTDEQRQEPSKLSARNAGPWLKPSGDRMLPRPTRTGLIG